MDNIANEAGLGGIGYQRQESDITRLAEWAGCLNGYISSVILELQESLDKPLYLTFNHHAAEDLSRIRMEDFLGLTVLEEAGEGKNIGMPKEFQDFTDMFAVDYNLIKDELEKQNGKEVTLEDYLLSVKSAGKFSHKMDKPVEEFISAVLDITAVKPLIECCTRYDMITGEDLSDFERGMKGVSAVVSLFTLGQGSIVMNRGKLALGETLKTGAKMLAVEYTKYLSGLGKVDDAIALNRVDYDELLSIRKNAETIADDIGDVKKPYANSKPSSAKG